MYYPWFSYLRVLTEDAIHLSNNDWDEQIARQYVIL